MKNMSSIAKSKTVVRRAPENGMTGLTKVASIVREGI